MDYRGLGLAFSRYLLSNTSLNVVSTSSRDASKARETILSDDKINNVKNVQDRLTTLDLDVTNEQSIQNAAKQVEEKFGKGKLRLLINVAGVVGCFLLPPVPLFSLIPVLTRASWNLIATPGEIHN